MENVDTVIVELVPEAGDDVQAMKAGLMEIADIFVVNKADRPGADSLVVGIKSMLNLVHPTSPWRIPVLATQAENDIGVAAVYEQIWKHRQATIDAGLFTERRAKQRHDEFTTALEKMVVQEFTDAISADQSLAEYVARVTSGDVSPYEAAERVFGIISGRGAGQHPQA